MRRNDKTIATKLIVICKRILRSERSEKKEEIRALDLTLLIVQMAACTKWYKSRTHIVDELNQIPARAVLDVIFYKKREGIRFFW